MNQAGVCLMGTGGGCNGAITRTLYHPQLAAAELPCGRGRLGNRRPVLSPRRASFSGATIPDPQTHDQLGLALGDQCLRQPA